MSPARRFELLTTVVPSPSGRARSSLQIVAALALLLGRNGLAVAAVPASAHAPVAASPIQTSFGRVPLHFEANHGQADARFQFIAQGHRHAIYLGPAEAVISLNSTSLAPEQRRSRKRTITSSALIRVTLSGATATGLAALEPLAGKVSYFLGNEPSDWRTGIPTFRKVEARGVYPGIDLIYHGSGEYLEYDFMVSPGAKPESIALHFEGADKLSIDARGDLIITVGRAELRQHKPVALQTIDGHQREVTAAFRLRDPETVVFDLGGYDRAQPLVIDPVLSYVTFFGGEANDSGWAVAVDAAGSAYLAGTTFSTRFRELPASGVFQPEYAGGNRAGGDGFVAKLNPAGTAFEYITYLGGKHEDGILDMTLDASGNAYLVGFTDSTNFPVTAGVFQTMIGGTNDPSVNLPFTDAFLTKLDPTGSALVYSTYLGGPGAESGYGVAVDGVGQAHVVGSTDSAVVFRVTNEVRTITCTNIICGTNGCVANRICGATAVTTNTAYVGSLLPTITVTNFGTTIDRKAKQTNLTETIIVTIPIDATFITVGFPTVNALQINNGGVYSYATKGGRATNYAASFDAFVAKFSADGRSLIYSTYLGGFNDDVGDGIAIDPSGAAVVCGWTTSLDFPIAPLVGAFQPILYGIQNAFVAKLDPAGGTKSLIYSTYLGGTGGTFANGATVDAAGNAFVIGSKAGSSFPSTPDALNRGGIYRSSDAGVTWTYSGFGLEHPLVPAIAVDPVSPATLYAGTGRGVFQSMNDGALWRNRSQGISTLTANAVAFDPRTPLRLYAGTIGNFYFSIDAGLTWIANSDGLGNTTVNSITVTPDASLIYAGTRGGVYRGTNPPVLLPLTNSPIAWAHASSGLGNTLVNAVLIDPTEPATLYAATEGGVFKSTDNAERWRGMNSGLTATLVKALVQDSAAPDILYAGTTRGFFKTTNAAANWSILTNGMGKPFITSLAIDRSVPGVIFAGTTNGIFRSTNGGNSWVSTTNGLRLLKVASLAVDSSTSPATVYAGLNGTNSFGGSNDAFLVKLSSDGMRLDYGVVFGGSRGEEGWDVAVDATGSAVIVGATDSSNFPTNSPPGSKQSVLAGKTDAFIGKLNPTASAWDYSFYLGGPANDYGYSVALDSAANVYVSGATYSGGFPTTNAVQPKLAGGSDGFLAKILGTPVPAVSLQSGQVIVSWPVSARDFILEACEEEGGPWFRVPEQPVVQGTQNIITLPSSSQYRILRLNRP